MSLKTSTTGSWPPIYDPETSIRHLPIEVQDQFVHDSIERAIRDQIDLDMSVLVDGQVRDNFVGLLAYDLPGYDPKTLPYHVVSRIRPADEPITVPDYLYAKNLVGDRPLKAQIIGPISLARNSAVDADSPYAGPNDPKLILDCAEALAQEVRYLVQAGAEIVQIDEPALLEGNLDLAFQAMKRIVDVGEIPFSALHICKNVKGMLEKILTHSPIKMVSLKGEWLQHPELTHINHKYLTNCGKQIGLGCLDVREYSIERPTSVQSFLDLMIDKLGEENIWAVTPNCGLRPLPRDVVLKKLEIMISIAKKS